MTTTTEHIIPGSPVRPPNARGTGGSPPRSRSRGRDNPWPYMPTRRYTPSPVVHRDNEGARTLEHDRERDRRELEQADLREPGADTYDSSMTYIAPRGDDDDLPREGESVTDWVNRTSRTPKIQKCDECNGRGRVGPYGKSRDCHKCKGSGYLDMEGRPHVAVRALLRAYARAKSVKTARRVRAARCDITTDPGWSNTQWSKHFRDVHGFDDTHYYGKDSSHALHQSLRADEDESGEGPRTAKVGYGETKAPTEVDTLRDEECPVCGESSAAYDGNECQVCGYVAPPEMFRDPDLDLAGQVDLRKDNLEQQVSDPNQDGLPSPGAPQALDAQQDAQVDQGQQVGLVDPDQITDDGVPQQQPQVDPFGNPLAPPQDPQAQQGVPSLDPEVQQAMEQAEGPMDADGDGSVDVEVQPTAPGQEQALPSGQPGTGGDGVPDLTCPACGFQADSEPPQSVSTQDAVDPLTDDQQGGDGLAVGDVCPNCGQALLVSDADAQQQDQAMGAQPAPVNDPASPVQPGQPHPKGRGATSSRRKAVEMSRPLMEAAKQQQRQIDALTREVITLKSQNAYLARLAGVTPQFEAIRKRADELNPAQPVPDPASEGPSETTQEAATPEASDNVFNLGETPGSVENLPADTTTTPLEPGVALPTEPFNELVDVQAPVAGTETQRPLDETKTLTDVRVGDPDNPEPAFPLNPAFQGQQTTSSRAMAALRLARLRIAAKIEAGDDLQVAAAIESGDLTPDQINHEIATLSSVVKAARTQQGRPAGLVPRAAAQQRSTPSMAPDAPITSVAFNTDMGREVADADLFLGDFD